MISSDSDGKPDHGVVLAGAEDVGGVVPACTPHSMRQACAPQVRSRLLLDELNMFIA
jgi:hypothetical protein